MAWKLSTEYPGSIQVNYVDLSKASVQEQFAAWRERLQAGRVAAPAVYVDEDLVSQGYIDYDGVVRAIEAARSQGTP